MKEKSMTARESSPAKRSKAGRPKGVPNKVTLEREKQLAASGIMPLEYMLALLRSPDATEDERKWAADRAAPYCHPRLTSVAVSGSLNVKHEDALAALK
jgi:hypothetical protein